MVCSFVTCNVQPFGIKMEKMSVTALHLVKTLFTFWWPSNKSQKQHPIKYLRHLSNSLATSQRKISRGHIVIWVDRWKRKLFTESLLPPLFPLFFSFSYHFPWFISRSKYWVNSLGWALQFGWRIREHWFI